MNNIIVSGETILSAENSGQPFGGRGFAANLAGGAHSTAPAGGRGLLPLLKNLPQLLAFGLNFRPFWPHPAVSTPTVFISHPLLRGLDRTLLFGQQKDRGSNPASDICLE